MATRRFQTDQGWAWLVLFAAMLNQILTLGFSFVLSAYYVSWMNAFGANRSVTAWVGSVNTGMLYLVGPLTTSIVSRFGVRRTVIGASLLSATGFIAGTFAQDIIVLIVFCGGVSGVGTGIGYIGGFAITGDYFEKWRGLAYGVASTGVGIAPMFLAPLQQYLIDSYTWRGALLISAGVVLNGCVVGAIMRDPPVHHASMSFKEYLRRCCDSSLFRDANYIILCLSNFMWGFGLSPVIVLFYDHLKGQGFTPEGASWAFTLWGILNVVGRLAAGFIIQTKLLHLCGFHVYYVSQIMTGISSVLLGIPGQSQLHYNAMAGAGGFFFGIMMSAWPMSCVELFGQRHLLSAMGWLLMSIGAGYFTGAPVGGFLADAAGSTPVAYYVGGSIIGVSGLVLLLLPHISVKHYDDDDSERAAQEADGSDRNQLQALPNGEPSAMSVLIEEKPVAETTT
ncbi:PREDICTED: monocarboxylate transporter 3-like [Priapulus caudatus]|uniref:Monocarboxylate transporter 3-like n=1 Tax=Priapulus caudatus TaxID=37621 RepID=A0ABM1F1S6_PRICU|nr:PREDICTED: monocarboxylate transporter 3-like [Priapulus caudatus]